MHNTLKAELIRKGLRPVQDIAILLQCNEKTVRNKLSGDTDFTVTEAFKIKENFFNNDSFCVEYLFETS